MGKAQADTADREDDALVWNVGVLMTERLEPGDWPPSTEWCDSRLAFVEDLFDHFGDARNTRIFKGPLAHLYPDTAEIPVAFDPDMLREGRLFWSLVEFGFRGDE